MCKSDEKTLLYFIHVLLHFFYVQSPNQRLDDKRMIRVVVIQGPQRAIKYCLTINHKRTHRYIVSFLKREGEKDYCVKMVNQRKEMYIFIQIFD